LAGGDRPRENWLGGSSNFFYKGEVTLGKRIAILKKPGTEVLSRPHFERGRNRDLIGLGSFFYCENFNTKKKDLDERTQRRKLRE